MLLEDCQVQQFIEQGFIRLDNAFPRQLADAGREILWRDTGCDPHNPTTWTQPVIRLGSYTQESFQQAVNTAQLHSAFDQLVGKGRWEPRESLGTFPIRFPSLDDPGDAGWHVDVSFADENSDPNDFFNWRVNVHSRGRALLMLFLFSDVSEQDAPTRIRVGSHLDMAQWLAPARDAGISLRELDLTSSTHRPQTLAVGAAGTVYLCHPFLVHAAQPHHGKEPRFMAQPPLYPAQPFHLHRKDNAYSPVEMAIRQGLGLE
ncbi:MAG: phytanoyl-CoA dioxygenase family protein [Abitibacteriaceae bacterium]|nr:phytanoyl-CoA dioxygenase family protein [Abditibacteriaceae bacterium]